MRKIKSFCQIIEHCDEIEFAEIVDKYVNDFLIENRIVNFDLKIGSGHGKTTGSFCRLMNLILVYFEYIDCQNLSSSLNVLKKELKEEQGV